jgi:molecular chaperone HscB
MNMAQLIDFSKDYFALFGLPPRYRFDSAQLDLAYRTLQSAVHPDRFATAGEPERRMALQSSARVNEAYRALKHPVDRAQYLLSLHGIEALAETDTALPQDFLGHQLDRREAVADAISMRDEAALEALRSNVQAEATELEHVLADELEGARALDAARMTVRKLKFLSKLAADIDAALTGDDA